MDTTTTDDKTTTFPASESDAGSPADSDAAQEAADFYADLLESTHNAFSSRHGELLDLIDKFDAAGCARTLGYASTPNYLVHHCKMKKTRAYEYTQVAQQLRDRPYAKDAFRNGQIDYTTLRLLLKYATDANEQELVKLAIELGYHGLERALAGADTEDNDEKKRAPSYGLNIRENENGLTCWFSLPPAEGEGFKAALKIGALAHQQVGADLKEMGFVGEDGQFNNENIDQALKEAQVRAENATSNAIPALTDAEAKMLTSAYGLPPAKLLLHALLGMINLIRSGATASTKLAPAAQVRVMMTTDGRAYMPGNLQVPARAMTNLVANGEFRAVTFDDEGLIINFGRKRRLASPPQIDALLTMWGHECAAPGCHHRTFIQIHHLDEWYGGGHTDLANLIPLCSGCHMMVTEGTLKILRCGPDVHFVYPGGKRWVARNRTTPLRQDHARTDAELPEWEEWHNFDD